MEISQSIINLRKVINNRAVAILLPGTSIKELEARIDEIKDIDLCYASVNDFWVLEQRILSKVDKRMSLVLCAAIECEFPSPVHVDFLRRKDNNMIITDIRGYHYTHKPLHEFMNEFRDKLLLATGDYTENALNVPSFRYPLNFMAQASFSVLIQLCIAGRASMIVLFGADGGRLDGGKLYYEGWQEKIAGEPLSKSEQRLKYDTMVLNQVFSQLLKNTEITYGRDRIPIYNCSLRSHYEMFSRIGYDEAFIILKDRISDNK